jgi:hypothetical protein
MVSRASTANEVTAFVNNQGYPGPVCAALAGLTGHDLWILTPFDFQQSGLSRLRAILLYRILHAHDEPPSEFICPITRCLIPSDKAVLLWGDGHSYDGTALTTWFEGGATTSPLTGAALTEREREQIPNYALRSAIESHCGTPRHQPNAGLIDTICHAAKAHIAIMEEAMLKGCNYPELQQRKVHAIEVAREGLRRCVVRRNLPGIPDGQTAIWLARELLLARRPGECVSLRCYRHPGGAWAATAEYCNILFIE